VCRTIAPLVHSRAFANVCGVMGQDGVGASVRVVFDQDMEGERSEEEWMV